MIFSWLTNDSPMRSYKSKLCIPCARARMCVCVCVCVCARVLEARVKMRVVPGGCEANSQDRVHS